MSSRARGDAEELIPIKLELSHAQESLLDYFCWSSDAPEHAVAEFAAGLCADRGLPPEPWHGLITTAMAQQIEEFKAHDKHFARTQHERLELIK